MEAKTEHAAPAAPAGAAQLLAIQLASQISADRKKLNKTAKNHPRTLIFGVRHPGTSLFSTPTAMGS
jgi:hypothetical protein